MEVPLVHDRGFEFVNPRLVMSNSGKSITLSESGDYMRMPCLGFMNVLARPHIVGPGQNVHEKVSLLASVGLGDDLVSNRRRALAIGIKLHGV